LVAAIIGLNITILDETVVLLGLPAIDRDLHMLWCVENELGRGISLVTVTAFPEAGFR
jgi:hypothetical protein